MYDLNWKVDLLLRMEEKKEGGANLKSFGLGPSKPGPIPKGPGPKNFSQSNRFQTGSISGSQSKLSNGPQNVPNIRLKSGPQIGSRSIPSWRIQNLDGIVRPENQLDMHQAAGVVRPKLELG